MLSFSTKIQNIRLLLNVQSKYCNLKILSMGFFFKCLKISSFVKDSFYFERVKNFDEAVIFQSRKLLILIKETVGLETLEPRIGPS